MVARSLKLKGYLGNPQPSCLKLPFGDQIGVHCHTHTKGFACDIAGTISGRKIHRGRGVNSAADI